MWLLMQNLAHENLFEVFIDCMKQDREITLTMWAKSLR